MQKIYPFKLPVITFPSKQKFERTCRLSIATRACESTGEYLCNIYRTMTRRGKYFRCSPTLKGIIVLV